MRNKAYFFLYSFVSEVPVVIGAFVVLGVLGITSMLLMDKLIGVLGTPAAPITGIVVLVVALAGFRAYQKTKMECQYRKFMGSDYDKS